MKKIIRKIVWLLLITILTISTSFASNNCSYKQIWNKYDDIDDLTYSPNWKSFIFRAEKNWKYILVKDWVEINKYDKVYSPIYSPDWKSLAFIAEKDWKKNSSKRLSWK